MTGATATVRELVYERANKCCERCGIYAYGGSVHHRRPRGMGGSKQADTNQPSNLILLCGSGTTGCHGWVESHRNEAIDTGLVLRQGTDPTAEPVTLRYGRVLLKDNGDVIYA
ncbi:hypothetical protein GCM10022234_00650 [Aeromicrobium panaciterrae]